jgi:uncharacterized protein (TIGR02246 family)
MANTALPLCVAALVLAACQPTGKQANNTPPADTAAASDTAADEQAIRANVDRWLQLVKAKDAPSISQLYTDDGAVMPANGHIGKGRAAIQQTWASMLQTPGFDLTFAPEQIIVSRSGDMALDRGTYRLTMAPGGKPQHDTGKYVVVWRKVGGDW